MKTKHSNIKHGYAGDNKTHPLYWTWARMKGRCYNLNRKDFKHFGGIGIKMDLNWFNDPMIFFEWAFSNGWRKGLEFLRIDKNGDFCPSNCKFGKDEKHGYAKRNEEHPLYSIWEAMKQRCYNPNNDQFEHYGGRGVKITCHEWITNPQKFIEWGINNGWQKGLYLDRIDNEYGNYCPENCRFVTPSVSNMNRRRGLKHKRKTDLPTGVWLENEKFRSCVGCNMKRINLGTFKTTKEASEMYQKALRYIKIHKILKHRDDLINFVD